jgi:hypothetical protein
MPTPVRLRTRFLFPFSLQQPGLDEVCAALDELSVPDRKGSPTAVWEAASAPLLYTDELVDTVARSLFSGSGAGGYRYRKLSEKVKNAWLQGAEVVFPGAEDRALPLAGDVQVELFVSHYGVGVLSITLEPGQRQLGVEEYLRFNYRLAQSPPRQEEFDSSEGDAATHARQVRARRAGCLRRQKHEGDDDRKPVDARFGKPGNEFHLADLVLMVLHPFSTCGLRVMQGLFSVYTICLFGDDVDLQTPEVRDEISPIVSALAQIEEPGHAGAIMGLPTVASTILNRRHWAGAGLLGAAHVVADQPDGHPFNEQRVARVEDKYFIPYLLAFVQRLVLMRVHGAAVGLATAPGDAAADQLASLYHSLLEFCLEGNYPQVSTREALHRYYLLCREAQGVPAALSEVRQAIADIDARQTLIRAHDLAQSSATSARATVELQTEFKELQKASNRQISIVARVQAKVEWLEVLFVSYYCAHLFRLLVEKAPEYMERWLSWGTAGVAVVAAAGAALFLRPWAHAPSDDEKVG